MAIESLVGHLKQSDIGHVYWLNFCGQFRAGLLDENIARQVFRTASTDKNYRELVARASIDPGKLDLSHIARQALYSASTDNMHAISACRAFPAAGDLPGTVSTVISNQTFESYCITSVPGFRSVLIDALTKTGYAAPGRGFGITQLFAELHKRGISCLNDLPGAAKSILPYITIKTRYARFWLAGDPKDLPNDPERVRDIFGLGYLKKGDWLLRVSLPTVVLHELLGSNATLIRRPGAFCVNDDVAPRFRGLTTAEHNLYPAFPVDSHGTTVDLERVAAGHLPDDGREEWICPQFAVKGNEIKLVLLGDIKTDRFIPTNANYKGYLEKALPLSVDEEHKIISQLTN